jgi:hypothetical protein
MHCSTKLLSNSGLIKYAKFIFAFDSKSLPLLMCFYEIASVNLYFKNNHDYFQ